MLPGLSRFLPVSVPIDQLSCLPEPFTPANGFSWRRHTNPCLSATFFMAAIGTWSLKTTTPEVPATEASETVQAVPAAKESYLSLLKGGFDYVKKSRVILNYCLIAIVLNFLLVPLNSLQAPIVEDVFKMGSELLSVMGA